MSKYDQRGQKVRTQYNVANGDVIIQSTPAWPVNFSRIRGPHASKVQNFADLCNLLILREYVDSNPKALQREKGKIDIDYITVDLAGQLNVFQCEYITGRLRDSDKKRIAESLMNALYHHTPTKWTLCIPINFLPQEKDWFRKELITQAVSLAEKRSTNDSTITHELKTEEISAVEIDYWCESKLLALLRKHDKITKAFFDEPPHDTLSSLANLVIDWRNAKWDYHNNAVFVSFAIANTGGRIARVEQIYIEVLDTYPTSETETPWVGAVMQEFRFDVELSPSQSKYTIGQELTFVYKHGDIDGFKIKLTSRARMYYKLIVKVSWYDIENKVMMITETEPFLAHFPHI